MIFNSFDFNLHKKINLHFIFYVIYYCSSNLINIISHFFDSLHFLTFYFFVNTEVGLKFRRLSIIERYS